MSNSKRKAEQLGMNASTARHRLVQNILFQLVEETGKNVCYHCGKKISREDFSIEHKVPWLNTDKPLDTYFDLSNIAFSHQSCNYAAGGRMNKRD